VDELRTESSSYDEYKLAEVKRLVDDYQEVVST